MTKTLLWDFDGTLAYRPGMWSGALSAVALRLTGKYVPPEEFRKYLREGFPWHTPHRPHVSWAPAAWWAALRPVLSRAFICVGIDESIAETLADAVRAEYLRPEFWHVFPDTAAVLQSLKDAGWDHVVASNHVPELDELVSSLGLRRWIAHVYSSGTLGYEKPNQSFYAILIKHLGGHEALWMIGDNYECDVMGAEASGISGILVRSSDPRAKYQSSDLFGVSPIVDRLQP